MIFCISTKIKFMGMESYIKGSKAEDIATKYVEAAGYKVIFRNWRCPYGEIDIIGKKDDRLAFFEVKYRSTDRYGYSFEYLSPSKISKIRKTIHLFMSKFCDSNIPWLLDGLCIFPCNESYKISHYKNLLTNL